MPWPAARTAVPRGAAQSIPLPERHRPGTARFLERPPAAAMPAAILGVPRHSILLAYPDLPATDQHLNGAVNPRATRTCIGWFRRGLRAPQTGVSPHRWRRPAGP